MNIWFELGLFDESVDPVHKNGLNYLFMNHWLDDPAVIAGRFCHYLLVVSK